MNISDRVLVEGLNATGSVRYIGATEFAEGEWLGVELDADFTGKNNGSVNGRRYFEPETSGVDRLGCVFVRESQLEALGQEKSSKERLYAIIEKLQTKLQSLHEQVEVLQKNVDKVEGEKADISHTLERVSVDKECLEDENARLFEELSSLKEAYDQLEAQCNLFKDEVETDRALEKEILSSYDESSEWQIAMMKKYKILEAEHNRLLEMLKETQKDNEQISADFADLKVLKCDNESLMEKLSEAQEVISHLKEQLSFLADSSSIIEKLTDENLVLANRVEVLQSDVKDLEQLHELDEQLEKDRAAIEEDLRNMILELENQTQSDSKFINDLQRRTRYLETQLSSGSPQHQTESVREVVIYKEGGNQLKAKLRELSNELTTEKSESYLHLLEVFKLEEIAQVGLVFDMRFVCRAASEIAASVPFDPATARRVERFLFFKAAAQYFESVVEFGDVDTKAMGMFSESFSELCEMAESTDFSNFVAVSEKCSSSVEEILQKEQRNPTLYREEALFAHQVEVSRLTLISKLVSMIHSEDLLKRVKVCAQLAEENCEKINFMRNEKKTFTSRQHIETSKLLFEEVLRVVNEGSGKVSDTFFEKYGPLEDRTQDETPSVPLTDRLREKSNSMYRNYQEALTKVEHLKTQASQLSLQLSEKQRAIEETKLKNEKLTQQALLGVKRESRLEQMHETVNEMREVNEKLQQELTVLKGESTRLGQELEQVKNDNAKGFGHASFQEILVEKQNVDHSALVVEIQSLRNSLSRFSRSSQTCDYEWLKTSLRKKECNQHSVKQAKKLFQAKTILIDLTKKVEIIPVRNPKGPSRNFLLGHYVNVMRDGYSRYEMQRDTI